MGLLIVTALCLVTIVPATCDDYQGQSRPNYGVDFSFMFKINNDHGVWKHIIDIPLPDYDASKIDNITIKCERVPYWCNDFKMVSRAFRKSVDDVFDQLKSFMRWRQDPQVLATVNRFGDIGTSRSKRSLLPFVGSIEKSLFGVATEDDVANVKKIIDDWTNLETVNKDEITRIGKNLASLSQLSSKQSHATSEGFRMVNNRMNNLTHAVNNRLNVYFSRLTDNVGRMDKMEARQHHFLAFLEYISNTSMTSLQYATSEVMMITSIQQVLQGYLPLAVVDPHSLTQALHIVERESSAVFPGSQLLYGTSQLGYYYSHRIVTPYLATDRLSLIIDVPLNLNQQPLNVFLVSSYPINLQSHNVYTNTPMNNTPISQGFSELSESKDILLISQDGSAYSTANARDLLACKGEGIKVCPKQFPLYPLSVPNCLLAIWKNSNFEDIMSYCNYKIRTKQLQTFQIPVQVTPLQSGRWHIEGPLGENWVVKCPARAPEVHKSCTSCVIQLECGCGITGPSFSIPTRLSSCDVQGSALKRNFTITPFLYHQSRSPWVLDLTGTSVSTHPVDKDPTINLPVMKLWDDVVDTMDNNVYSFDKIYKSQGKSTQLYASQADALINKIKTMSANVDALGGMPASLITLAIILSFVDTAILAVLFFIYCCKGVKADSILDELKAETTWFGSMETLLLIVGLGVNILILLLLIQVYRITKASKARYSQDLPVVKALGYVRHNPGTKLFLRVIGLFGEEEACDEIPFQIKLTCLSSSQYIDSLEHPDLVCSVQRSGDTYEFCVNPALTIMSTTGKSYASKFHVKIPQLHKAVHVSPWMLLKSIKNPRLISCQYY